MKIKKSVLEEGMIGLTGLVMILFLFVGVLFTGDYVIGAANITNLSVLARVNVTNTEPNITSVVVDDNVTSPANTIDLVANDIIMVYCNATVFDYNGWQDIDPNKTNATLHIKSKGRNGATDNNYRYRNESCGSCKQGEDSTTAICDCKFAVQYYANDSTEWICNITVGDNGGWQKPEYEINLSDTEVSSEITITDLLAIDTPTLIDYGNLSVTETSSEIIHNVTNVGNINLNLSLRGYGGTDEDIGINYTMICDFGNITFGHQRYAFDNGTDFGLMTNLSNSTVITNFTLPQRINDNTYGWDRNSTYWKLQVPLSVGGICNGTIIFGAIDGEN